MANTKTVKYPLKIGKKQVTLLDDDDSVIATFEVGLESLAEQVCKIMNRNEKKERFRKGDLNSIF